MSSTAIRAEQSTFKKETWKASTFDAKTLRRLGVNTSQDELVYPWKLPPGELKPLERIVDLALCIIEQRSWTYSFGSGSYPGLFAKLLENNGKVDDNAWAEVADQPRSRKRFEPRFVM